jgi:hypothetical protein
MSFFSRLFPAKIVVETRSPGQILMDQKLAEVQAKQAQLAEMQETAKKAALINSISRELAAFDAASLALRVAEDLAEAEELSAKAEANFAVFDSFMADPHSAIAAVKAAKAAKNKKTNP